MIGDVPKSDDALFFGPPNGLTAFLSGPFFRYGGGIETSAYTRIDAGACDRHHGSAYAVQHGPSGHGAARRHGERVRPSPISLHRPHAELHRLSRLRHSVRPSGLASCN